MNDRKERLHDAITEGMKELSELSEHEYHQNLDELTSDPNLSAEKRLMRVGRLMGVALKLPFAKPQSIDPAQSLTGAFRQWHLQDNLLLDPNKAATWQYELMDRLGVGEYQFGSVEDFAFTAKHETGFFGFLASSFQKYICSNPHLIDKINKAVEDQRGAAQALTPQALLGVAGPMIATYLVQAIPWLTVAASPIIAGLVVILGTIGIDAFCSWCRAGGITREEEK
jgi:hypothetical protein